MQTLLDIVLRQILGQPFLLISIIVFIGYIAMKMPMTKAVSGSIKAGVGVLALGIGAGQLIGNFGKLVTAMNENFGVSGVLLDTYSTMVACNDKLGDFASWSIYTMLAAFIVNIILVIFRKYTKIRAVFLTGNVMLVQTAIATYIVWRFLQTGMIATVLIAGTITALYWGIFSTILIKPTKEITGADFTIGHQQMLGSYLAYKFGGLFGKAEDDVERIKLPGWLNIIQDNIVASAIVFFTSVIIIFFAIGGEGVAEMSGGKNIVVYAIQTALTLAASVYVLLTGVRLFVGELMMSFQGISNKLLPGAVVAVDTAAIFGFAPKAVMLGFVFGAVGQICGIVGLIVFKAPILIIPGFIPLFFDNATIGVFANKKGGWKAAAALPFMSGLIQIFGTAVVAGLMDIGYWQGSFDWATVWLGIIGILKLIGSALGIAPV
ncbi:PTS ascorbate transporter subunit IIC [Clostridium sediminicola]|uniref:PTS ascorbate transporter subunit IIC n=1 Tax=Clostridium sediminicola TaxID=3114879 RepID=UPI0031F1C8F7